MGKNVPKLSRSKRHTHQYIGPYSKHGAWATMDGRSREAQYMKARRAELTAHVGGSPNVVQRLLIERAVWLSIKLELLNEKMVDGEVFKPRDHNHYLAWSNGLTRTLAALGVNSASTLKGKTLTDILSEETQPEPHQEAA